jgi:hypothetical protein
MALKNLNFNMDISRKLKRAAEFAPKTSLVLSEFLAVVAGEKAVLAVTFPDESQVKLIKSKFPDLIVSCSKKVFFGKQQVCAVSKNKSLAKQTAEYLDLGIEEQGKLLGYPKCCVEKHQNLCKNSLGLNSSLRIYQSYQGTKKCNFLTNNLFNFCSRLGKKKENFEFLNKYYHLNEKHFPIPLWDLQIISHIPCSYDCKASIKIGKKIDFLLKKYAPATEKIIRETLSRPVLFFDLFKLVLFDGYLKKNILYYKKIVPPYFLLENPLMKNIKNGNKIIVHDNKIEIFKNNLSLFIYQKKSKTDGFILDFSEDL